MAEFIKVAKVSDLAPGEKLLVDYLDSPVGLFNLEGQFYAIDDVCTHDGGPLVEGELHGHVIVCPRHGARFDVKTGAVLTLPAYAPVGTYTVKIEGEDILIAPDLEGGHPGFWVVKGKETMADNKKVTDEGIREALREVSDPELHLDVVTLGLIREINVDTKPVNIKMLLTTPFCPYGPWLVQRVKDTAEELVGDAVYVQVLMEPWSPEMMEDPTVLGFF
jgi:3-phenylpropionate/trans-cinnamate dioxygenase ferredoxin component